MGSCRKEGTSLSSFLGSTCNAGQRIIVRSMLQQQAPVGQSTPVSSRSLLAPEPATKDPSSAYLYRQTPRGDEGVCVCVLD